MENTFVNENIDSITERFYEAFKRLKIFYKKANIVKEFSELAYPENPCWSYCLPIIANYKCKNGNIVDIGVHLNDYRKNGGEISLSKAIVYSNEGGDYSSGDSWLNNEESKLLAYWLLKYDMLSESDVLVNSFKANGRLTHFLLSDTTDWDLETLFKSTSCYKE